MSKKIRRVKPKSEIGPRIVRAWFDTVINPVLRALETEQPLLAKKDWTWQFLPGALEWIRPVASHIDPLARDNLEQFMNFYPGVQKAIEDHDKEVSALSEACKELQRVVEKSPELADTYRRFTSAENLSELGTTLSDLFGAYPLSHHLAILTQYIVNNKADLPSYYTPARFWNKYRDEFLAVLNAASVQSHYESTVKAGKELLRSVERLTRSLKEARLQLSLEYDVPCVTAGSISKDAIF